MRKCSVNLFVGLLLTGTFGLFCLSPVARAASLVIAWGDNTFGQTNVPPDLTNVLAIASGFYHGLALNGDGTVTAWGKNDLGRTNVPEGLSNVVAIAGGEAHSLALKADGTITAWGDNSLGQTNVPVDLSNAVAIAAGRYHSLALRADGTVAAWGDNTYGQTNVPAVVSNVVAIAAGSSHCLVLRADGTVLAWGDNSSDQANVPVGLADVVAIAAGDSHCLSLKADGRFVAWGDQTNLPARLVGCGATIISIHAGTTDTNVSKLSAFNGNIVVNGNVVIDGGGGNAILANGRANIATNTIIARGAVSMTNWNTANEIPDYTAQGTSNTLFDLNRFIAVADLTTNALNPRGNNHFTNTTSFITAANRAFTNAAKALEGVIVVDVHGGVPDLTPTLLPNGINVKGTLFFNFDSSYGPLDKIINTATININPANLIGLVATNPATYTTGYPPVYYDNSKNPTNIDITSKGFANFSSADDLPAFMQNTASFDIHGNANICGAFYVPSFVEIENKANGQTQYFRGTLIAGAGVYLEKTNSTTTSIFSCDPKVVTVAVCSSHKLALRTDGRVVAWGSQPDVLPGLTNVVAIAAGASHSLALVGDGPSVLAASLTNPTLDVSGFSISLPTQSGRVYRLEYKNSWDDTNWTGLPLAAGNGVMLTLTDSTATNSPQRFYRVSRW